VTPWCGHVAYEGQITMISEYEEAPGIACNLRILGAYEPGETGPALLTEMLVCSRDAHLLRR
jgi:hypothetical protein